MPPRQGIHPDTTSDPNDPWENFGSSQPNHGPSNNEKRHTIADTVAMEQLDPFEPVERPSVFHRESFVVQFVSKEGPRAVVFLVVFLAIGLGSTVGVVPAVMTDRYARLNHGYSAQADCSAYEMGQKPQECLDGSADAQMANAWGSLVSHGLAFITSSLMGSIGDEHGRRMILIGGVFLSLLRPMCLILIQMIPDMSPTWYYAAGACGGLISWVAVALTSLSDVMPPEWRAASFGMLLAASFLGFAMAPQMALFFTHFQVSVLSFGLCLIGFLNTVFFFPETLDPEKATIAREVRSAHVEGFSPAEMVLWNVKRPFWELSILNRSRLFRSMAVLAFFSGMVSSGDGTLLLYYLEERLSFNDHDVAFMFMMTGLLGIFAQTVVLKHFIECVGERLVITFCFLLGATNNTMYGLATSKTMIFVAAAVDSITNMSFPTISAIKANNVDESEQGRIQGALFSVQALAYATGPMAMRLVYHLTKDGAFLGPGSMFVFAGMLLLVAAGCGYSLPKELTDSRRHRRAYHNETSETEEESTPFVDSAATDSAISMESYGSSDDGNGEP